MPGKCSRYAGRLGVRPMPERMPSESAALAAAGFPHWHPPSHFLSNVSYVNTSKLVVVT